MYIAVHRVVSPSGDEGINVFLHEHGQSWGKTQVADIPSKNPGKLVERLVELEPGVNRVRSYLDIAMADGASWPEVEAELLRTLSTNPVQRLPWSIAHEGRFFALYMDPDLAQSWQNELAMLIHAVRSMLRSRAA